MNSLSKTDVHIFEIRGNFFLLDVEGNKLFSLSPDAYKCAVDRINGNETDPQTFSAWRAGRKLDKIWKNIISLTPEHVEDVRQRLETPIPPLTGLWLGLAHTCNLGCTYCFANEPSYLLNNNPLMSWEMAKRAVDFLIEREPERMQFGLIFFGGEPLLQFDLIKRIVDYCCQLQEQGKKFTYAITTNGTLLTPEIYNYMVSYNFSIMLSLDGTKTIHDHNRPYLDGRPSWDNIMDNLKQLNDVARNIMARVTVQDVQVPLIEIYKTMRAAGFQDVALVEICPNSGEIPVFPEKDIPVWKEQYLNLAEYIAETEARAYDGALSSLSGYVQALRERERSFYCCSTGIRSFYVTPDGDLYPCMRLISDDRKNIMGSIFTSLDAQKVNHFVQNNIMNKSCRKCWARYLCGGMCYGDSFAVSGDIRKPISEYCKITRHKIEVAAYILKRLKESGKIRQHSDGNIFNKMAKGLRILRN
ncbi:MAG: radical SAM protein [Deltaproteobacteria bacterium]